MRGVEIPPPEDDFTADPVELFFDLAFVFAFSRLVYHLVHHPDWTGIGEFALLMFLIWFTWSQFTWSANAVAGNARRVRLLFLVGTLASVPMAASVTTAFDDGGPTFAIPLAVIVSLATLTMVAGFPRGHAVRRSMLRYSTPTAATIVILIVGGFLDRGPRVVLWLIGAALVMAGTLLAGNETWLVRPGHFAERHGLIVIVALGEVIVAVGIPVVEALEEGEGLPGATATAMIAAGAFACLMWWAYFDRVNRALEHRHGEQTDDMARGRFARDVYTYAHLPIVGGVILVAAALEEIALHPKDVLPTEFRWMLVGGMALFFGGVAAAVWRAYSVVARERILAGTALAVVVATIGGSVDGLVLLLVVNVLLFAVLLAEQIRIEGRPSLRVPAVGVATD